MTLRSVGRWFGEAAEAGIDVLLPWLAPIRELQHDPATTSNRCQCCRETKDQGDAVLCPICEIGHYPVVEWMVADQIFSGLRGKGSRGYALRSIDFD